MTPMDLIVTGADALQCLQQVGRTLIKEQSLPNTRAALRGVLYCTIKGLIPFLSGPRGRALYWYPLLIYTFSYQLAGQLQANHITFWNVSEFLWQESFRIIDFWI